MFEGFNWSDLLPYVAALSVILTVIVALYGLRQGHYSKGKLTRRGKRAVGAIILLGLVSLVSGIADRYVSAAKEKADAEERTRQFERQMASLQRVTGDLGTVRGSLQDSLRRQEQLYGVASQNVRMSGAIQQQAQANTLSVLRRVFTESNRVAAERIAISVTHRCDPTDHPYPRFPRVREATLVISGPMGREVSLTSNQILELQDGIIVHGFLGDLGAYETFPAWRSARLSMRLLAVNYPLGRPLEIFAEVRAYEEGMRQRGLDPNARRCAVTAMLILNGRQILTVSGNLQQQDSVSFEADFDNLRVDQGRLPRFIG